ncbi:MAG: hypothetical protein KDI27_02805 [Gammaproteobacteria bacterium]|nr:hypothetical protein [Gammaproteobacteria bacterium]MCB1849578.1 hypothetical protein [Gammaproteobacteria bacterium]
MENQKRDALGYYRERGDPIPRWMAIVYLLLIVGGLVLLFLAYRRWLT